VVVNTDVYDENTASGSDSLFFSNYTVPDRYKLGIERVQACTR